MKTFFLVLIFLSYVLVEINANGGRHDNKHRRHHDRDDDWDHHRRHGRDHHDRDRHGRDHHDRDHHDRDHHDRDHDDHKRHHERGHHHRRHHRNHHDRDDHHRRHGDHHRRHGDHHRRHRDHRDRHHHDREHYEIGLHHVLGRLLHKWESKASHDRFRNNEWNFDANLIGESKGYSHQESNNGEYQGEQQSPRYTSSNPTYQAENKPTTPNYHSNDDNTINEEPYDVNDDFAPQYAPEIPDDNWDNDNDTETDPDTNPDPIDEPNYHNQGNNNDNHNDNNNTPVPTPKHYKSGNPGKGEGVLTPIKQGKSETGPNHGGDGLVDQAPVLLTDNDHEDLNDNEENTDNSTVSDFPEPEGLIRARKEEDSNWVLGLAIGIPAGIVLLALIVVGVLLYRRKQSLVEVEIDVPEKGWVTHT